MTSNGEVIHIPTSTILGHNLMPSGISESDLLHYITCDKCYDQLREDGRNQVHLFSNQLRRETEEKKRTLTETRSEWLSQPRDSKSQAFP